eukprot:TRINITY_DN18162_c0_g1_i2.p1 TRINITY_DN18162_c0_g1~~TRINITY_DN18162_c0_g1_i2.p1  ORF type:complete len:469 (+),score=54.38 TRINITY_DN18162_c0_g1_i2:231-1637(+)
MPATSAFGRRLPFASDDLVFSSPITSVVHLSWAALLWQRWRWRAAGVDAQSWTQSALDLNAYCCLAIGVMDLFIAWFASRGSLGDPEPRRLVPRLLEARIFGKVALIVSLLLVCTTAALEATSGGESLANVVDNSIIGSELLLHVVFVVTRPVILRMGYNGVLVNTVTSLMFMFGGFGRAWSASLDVLMKTVHDDVDLVPLDVLFGLWLVGKRQRHRRLYRSRVFAVEGGSPVPKASPLDFEDSREDVRDVLELLPFVSGVYGWGLYVLEDFIRRILEGDFSGLCSGCWRFFRSREVTMVRVHRCDSDAGDWPLHERALHHTLVDHGRQETHRTAVRLASWKNKDEALPVLVLESQDLDALVISIRGTFSGNDVLVDLNAHMDDYEPPLYTGEAAEEGGKKFQAHSGMLLSMRHVMGLLQRKEILGSMQLLSGDCRILCTGHSLGAGVGHPFHAQRCIFSQQPSGPLM